MPPRRPARRDAPKPNTQTLSAAEYEALVRFANANGRGWKQKLQAAWERGGRIEAPLHAVRNRLGPSWLKRFSFTADPHAARKANGAGYLVTYFVPMHASQATYNTVAELPVTDVALEEVAEACRVNDVRADLYDRAGSRRGCVDTQGVCTMDR